MSDLLLKISQRERIKAMLRDLRGTAGESLVQELVDELERLLSERHREVLAAQAGPGSEPVKVANGSPAQSAPPAPEERPEAEASEGFPVNPFFEEEDSSAPSFFQTDVPPQSDTEEVRTDSLAEHQPASPEESENAAPVEPPGAELGTEADTPDWLAGVGGETEETEESAVPLTKHHQFRVPIDLDDDDWVYLHGVASIPFDEKPSPKPFMLEEKGIDNREFACALDRGGLRFFLSRIPLGALNVSKAGVLLLNKPDSIRIHGIHAGILNDLRAHGVLLPFEFGTVAMGKEALFEKIDAHLFDLNEALDELTETTWWILTVSMLDARLVQVIGSEKPAERRERNRPSFQPDPHQKRIDIKTLERILNKQKKIAESVHEEVSQIAEHSKVEMMVNMSSGSSDDWKEILKASYEVPPPRVPRLNRLLTDIQYRHLLFELMLTLNGNREPFSFSKK